MPTNTRAHDDEYAKPFKFLHTGRSQQNVAGISQVMEAFSKRCELRKTRRGWILALLLAILRSRNSTSIVKRPCDIASTCQTKSSLVRRRCSCTATGKG